MEEIVTIQLFGRPYRFKAESDVAKAREVADYLVSEVAKVEGGQPNQISDVSKLAILISVALNITGEHVALKENYSALVRNISERSASLIRLLDQTVR